MFWLALAVVLPKIITPTWVAYGVAQWFGIGSLAVALLVSTWLIYRRHDSS